MPAGGHKSAEPLKVGRLETSTLPCPASETAMESDRTDVGSLGRKRIATKSEVGCIGRKASGAPVSASISENRAAPQEGAAARGRNCDGLAPDFTRGRVGSWSSQRNVNGTGNSFARLSARLAVALETVEATDERARGGRSLRSSPRTGKPSTWRRQTVDTACRQEMDTCPTR